MNILYSDDQSKFMKLYIFLMIKNISSENYLSQIYLTGYQASQLPKAIKIVFINYTR